MRTVKCQNSINDDLPISKSFFYPIPPHPLLPENKPGPLGENLKDFQAYAAWIMFSLNRRPSYDGMTRSNFYLQVQVGSEILNVEVDLFAETAVFSVFLADYTQAKSSSAKERKEKITNFSLDHMLCSHVFRSSEAGWLAGHPAVSATQLSAFESTLNEESLPFSGDDIPQWAAVSARLLEFSRSTIKLKAQKARMFVAACDTAPETRMVAAILSQYLDLSMQDLSDDPKQVSLVFYRTQCFEAYTPSFKLSQLPRPPSESVKMLSSLISADLILPSFPSDNHLKHASKILSFARNVHTFRDNHVLLEKIYGPVFLKEMEIQSGLPMLAMDWSDT